MPLVLRDPTMTEKTQTWMEIRKAVPAINCTGGNPVEVRRWLPLISMAIISSLKSSAFCLKIISKTVLLQSAGAALVPG